MRYELLHHRADFGAIVGEVYLRLSRGGKYSNTLAGFRPRIQIAHSGKTRLHQVLSAQFHIIEQKRDESRRQSQRSGSRDVWLISTRLASDNLLRDRGWGFHGEMQNRLGPAVLRQLEIFFSQIDTGLAVRIVHHHTNRDQVHTRLEGRTRMRI